VIRWLCAVLVGCSAPATRPMDPEQVALAPLPTIRGETPGPTWCWSEPTALRPTDEHSHYVSVQIERAILARLAGTVSDDAFPHLAAVRGGGNPIFVVGPALVAARDLATDVHAVRSVEPALAAAWDSKHAVELVKLELVGYVQDDQGRDAQRFALTLRHLASDPAARSRGGTVAELCVVVGADGVLAVFSRVLIDA
jgi:hypothetical protein